MENLFPFLVPLLFLAIWAVTSLFNREAQPLPPRVGRPIPPGGPAGGTRSPYERLGDRPGDPAGGRPAGRPVGNEDDLLVIRDTTPRPAPSAGPRPAPALPSPRRAARSRAAAKAAPRPAESTPTTPLTSPTKLTLGEGLRHTEGLKSIAQPSIPSLGGSMGSTDLVEAAAAPAMTAARVRAMLSSPGNLRDAFLAAEVLFREPLALRRPTPGWARRRRV